MGDLQIVQQEQGPIVNLIGPLLVKRVNGSHHLVRVCVRVRTVAQRSRRVCPRVGNG